MAGLIDLPELTRGLAGAWRLLKLDRTGLFHFNATPEGARRSFQAALFALPVSILAVLLGVLPAAPSDQTEFGAAAGLAAILLYVIDWTIIPVLAILLAEPLGWQKRVPVFICAYNYGSLLAIFLQLMVTILATLLDEELRMVALIAVSLATYVYLGMVARAALGLRPAQVVLFCIALFAINYLLGQMQLSFTAIPQAPA